MKRSLWLWRITFLALPLTVYAYFVVWPLFSSFVYSFTNWNGFGSNFRWVGFANFERVFTDPLFLNAIKNTFIWTSAAVLLPNVIGLGLALILDTKIRGYRAYKTIYYLPVCLSSVVVGQVWIWIYQPDWGALNAFLSLIGQTSGYAWLSDPQTALYAVIVAWSWQQVGLSMVIYLSGLTNLPNEMMEAAELDNIHGWKRIWYLVLPLLKPATIVVVALSVINSLKGFDIVYIMTGGGPFHASDTLAMFMYNESFKKYMMGYGSAIAVILFSITMIVVVLYFRQLKKLDSLFD